MPPVLPDTTLDQLGLSNPCIRSLTQAGRLTLVSDQPGVHTMDELVRSEDDNLLALYEFGPAHLREVVGALQVLDLRLADPNEGPCLSPGEGDRWIRLRRTGSSPSWWLWSSLPSVTLDLIIGSPHRLLARQGITTIDDARKLTRMEFLKAIEWWRTKDSARAILNRLEKELERLGFHLSQ